MEIYATPVDLSEEESAKETGICLAVETKLREILLGPIAALCEEHEVCPICIAHNVLMSLASQTALHHGEADALAAPEDLRRRIQAQIEHEAHSGSAVHGSEAVH